MATFTDEPQGLDGGKRDTQYAIGVRERKRDCDYSPNKWLPLSVRKEIYLSDEEIRELMNRDDSDDDNLFDDSSSCQFFLLLIY